MVHWLQPPLQKEVTYREGDTIIAVPAKSGTTWTMNIFHQLRTGGDPDFKDIYAEVPWPEFKEGPDQPNEELLERWNAIPTSVKRGFKTHSQPGDGPGDFCVYRKDMKYIVVMRNPEEAIVSFKPFLEAHSLDLWKHWDAVDQREHFIRPTFTEFYHDLVLKGFPHMPPEMIPPGGLLTMLYFGFINQWWKLRHEPNVLMIHFSNMKKDHEGSLRKLAKFLDMAPTQQQWPKVLEYTTYKWMKRNQEKFEVPTLLRFKMLNEGPMVRKGETGKQAEDGMTPEISADIAKWAKMMVPDDAARHWMFYGGSIDDVVDEA